MLRSPIIWGEPFSISIEPTSICNLKCPQCPTGINSLLRPRGTMSMGIYEQILGSIGKNTWYLNLYLQGEPTIHPKFAQMVELAKEKKMFVITSTNGHFIDAPMATEIVASGLDKLIISYDGATQEVFEKYRIGGRIESVEMAIRLLSEARIVQKKRTPIIEVQYIVFKHNEHQIQLAKKQATDLGADFFVVKSAQFYNNAEAMTNQTSIDKYKRYSILGNDRLNTKLHRYNHCWISWSAVVVSWQGAVFPCCFDKDGDYRSGWAQNNSIAQIGKSKGAVDFKRQILSDRKLIAICNNCTGGNSFFG